MTRVFKPKEVEAVLKLEGPERYEYFIKNVVDGEGLGPLPGWVGIVRDGRGAAHLPALAREGVRGAVRRRCMERIRADAHRAGRSRVRSVADNA